MECDRYHAFVHGADAFFVLRGPWQTGIVVELYDLFDGWPLVYTVVYVHGYEECLGIGYSNLCSDEFLVQYLRRSFYLHIIDSRGNVAAVNAGCSSALYVLEHCQ